MYATAYTAVLLKLDAMTATWFDQEKFIAEVEADMHALLCFFDFNLSTSKTTRPSWDRDNHDSMQYLIDSR